MPKYMLDTNILSFIAKDLHAVRQRVALVGFGDAQISVMTKAEVLFGLAKLPAAAKTVFAMRALLSRFTVLPWDDAAASVYGPLKAQLQSIGRPLGELDLLIAAHALSTGSVLVTNDRAFVQVPGLLLDDWTQ